MAEQRVKKNTGGRAEETIAADEAAVVAEFIRFLKEASAKRHPTGVVRRFNQGRHTACVEAGFTVPEGLPPDRRVGLFAQPGTYPAWIRFANASSASDEEKDVRGMSIRVSVAGQNLTPGATSQDFVLNSHPVMVAPDTKSFMELLQAIEAGGARRVLYFITHPKAARIGLAARQHHTSHLDIPYWSTTPYLFGAGRAVKYLARPCAPAASRPPERLSANYLRDAMAARLSRTEACFDFLVQFQTDARKMPIEDATAEWDERDSPFHAVARIVIPPQDVTDASRRDACERTAFNPWHCLPDHRPLGNMNRARREIYDAMARFRQERR
jgi:hypothetical protein